jgi:NAD-dependent deacetylase
MKKIVVLSGAGMSADSGISTFRDSGGLWEGHDVMQVASPEGFRRNPGLVLDFYNQRRKQLFEVVPNAGHRVLADLEAYFDVCIVTQNIDDLHERAGSTEVLHLHGELLKARSTGPNQTVYPWKKDILPTDTCKEGFALRPHIVWFGEAVPLLQAAAEHVIQADILLVVGTSLQVYPAAGLLSYKKYGIPVYLVDPNPSLEAGDLDNLTILSQRAAAGLPILASQLIGTGRGSDSPNL